VIYERSPAVVVSWQPPSLQKHRTQIIMKNITIIVCVALMSLFAIGCKSESERKWESAKDAADEAVEDAGDALKDAKDAAKEAAKETKDRVTK
jgi:hypothetical protein